MMSNLNALYTEQIFLHDKHPHHAGLREPFAAQVDHVNPVCGDAITLRIHLGERDGEQIIEDISYEAEGCAMSRASASMLADNLIGMTLTEARGIVEHMEHVMTSRGSEAGDPEKIGDAVALAGAAKFPARVKCVLMSWKALRAALLEAGIEL